MRDVEKKRTNHSEYKVINGDRVRVGRRKRRNNFTLYYYLAFFVIVVTITILSVTVLFNASEVEVTGADLYTSEQIKQISGVAEGNNLIRLDTHTAEKCVKDALSYVDDVRVLRSFPDKISIQVTQAVAQANIESNGMYCVVSESGRVLETGLESPKSGLIVVKGFDLVDDEVGGKVLSEDGLKQSILDTILSAIETMEMEGIVAVNISDRANIKLNYDNRINILLGSSLDLEFKLNAVKLLIDTKIDEDFNGVIYYHNESSGASVIASDKLPASLAAEAPEAIGTDGSEDGSEAPLQEQYQTGLK